MKRKNTLLKGFQAKKMDKGGMFKPFSSNVNQGIAAGATVLDGGIDVLDPKDKFGTRSGVGAIGSGAVKGAAAGAALGPAGLVGGALIGAATSFFGNKAAQEEKQNILTSEVEDATKARDAQVTARVANRPELQYGSTDASMYKLGGTIKGKPATKHFISKTMPKSAGQTVDLMPTVAVSPTKMIKFDTGGDTGYGGFTQTTPIGTTTRKQMTPEEKAYIVKKTGMKDNQFNENIPVVEKYLTQFRSGIEPVGSPPVDKNNAFTMNEDGTTNAGVYNRKSGSFNFAKYKKGGLLPTSSTTATVKGKSHAEGGVKFPDLGVELEGGETVAGDFVFSKELGFADIHEKLGKRMGKNEKRPQTVLNMKTAEAMKRKEGFLKIYQEQIKKAKGIPNEIDNSAEQMKEQQATGPTVMAKGGFINLEDDPKKKKVLGLDKPIGLNEVVIQAPRKVKFPIDDLSVPEIPPIIPPVFAPDNRMAEGSRAVQDMIKNNEKATAEKPSSNPNSSGKIGDIVNSVAPFASNLVNSFRKLPNPNKPVMDETITPNLINLDASRAEATRTRRGADKTAAANMNGNNQVAATKAANLTQEIRATNEINQTEQNANAQIKNQAQLVNSQITRGNNLKTDFYNSQKIERTLKEQELSAANIADVGNKIQLQNRDAKLFELEDTKNLLTILSDPTGATIRAAGPALQRIIKDPKVYQQIMKQGEEIGKLNAEDRAAAMKVWQAQLNAAGVSKDILNTNKALPVDTKFEKATLQNNFLKAKAKN